MKVKAGLIASAVAGSLFVASGIALADSSYGFNTSGGAAQASAHVDLKVTVPNLILLRVGSTNGTVDLQEWTVGGSIPSGSTIASSGNDVPVDWNGTAPTLTPVNPSAITAYAWTNGATAAITCGMGAWAGTGGPVNADFAVTSTGTLSHPGANLGACASTPFSPNTLLSSTWTYSLGGTPTTWAAGVYTNQITYTASSV